jgi:hydrogenase maturation protease
MTFPRLLIIGYGNPQRGDDGLAWRAADELEKALHPPEVQIVRCHQLAPELAERFIGCDAVIFVDAAAPLSGKRRPGEIHCEEIDAQSAADLRAPALGHQFSPAALVALASQIYQVTPRAFCMTLTGESFNHGDSLSATVLAALPQLIRNVKACVEEVATNRSNKA